MHSPAQQRLAAADARRGAAARAARAAAASRRAAAAKRRLVLTLALLVITGVTWTLVGLVSAPVALAIVPTALFVAVLALSRRAAKQAKAADARLAEEVHRARRADQARAARIAASTHARDHEEKPEGQSSLRIDVDPTSLIAEETDVAAEREAEAHSDQPWTPVPVPAPVYTMKPAAPRRDVEPVRVADSAGEVGDTSAASPASPAATEPVARSTAEQTATARRDGSDSRAGAKERSDVGDVDVPRAEPTRPAAAPSVNIQEVLERRRAVGQ